MLNPYGLRIDKIKSLTIKYQRKGFFNMPLSSGGRARGEDTSPAEIFPLQKSFSPFKLPPNGG